MVDLKKYIYKKSQINRIINSREFDDTIIDDIVFFTKHCQYPLLDHFNGYIQVLENEFEREIFTFCDTYWLEDFGLDLNEGVQMILSCFVDCSIEERVFYEEENDDYAITEYGMSMQEYIETQFVDFLEEQGLTKEDLDINYGYLTSCCQYSIILVKINKEYIPFAKIAKYLDLYPTSKKDTYLCFIEDWGDGYGSDYEFDLEELKREVKKAKLPIIESNLSLSKKYKRLRLFFNSSSIVDDIFAIMNTKTEVMF